MKLRLLIVLFLFLAFPVVGCFSEETSRQEIATWDFGQVKENTIVKHTFVIENGLPGPLAVKDVTVSCECIAAEAKIKVVPPKGKLVLEVSLNSKGYSGDVQQSVFVFTDDLKNPILKFVVKAFVVN